MLEWRNGRRAGLRNQCPRRVGSSPTLSTNTYALKRGPSPHYIFNMSAHRARIPTKLPLALVLEVPVAVNDCVRPMICGLRLVEQ